MCHCCKIRESLDHVVLQAQQCVLLHFADQKDDGNKAKYHINPLPGILSSSRSSSRFAHGYAGVYLVRRLAEKSRRCNVERWPTIGSLLKCLGLRGELAFAGLLSRCIDDLTSLRRLPLRRALPMFAHAARHELCRIHYVFCHELPCIAAARQPGPSLVRVVSCSWRRQMFAHSQPVIGCPQCPPSALCSS